LACTAPVDCEPMSALLPDQAPEAVHEVASRLDQVRVAEPPELSELGFA
jgi:hypothetical protein